jgi:hypothetical protein
MAEAQAQETTYIKNNRNAERIAKEEAELKELMKNHVGAEQEEPDSEGTEEAQVQDESNPEQEATKETPEAQEADDKSLTAEERSYKKRYADIQKHLAKKESEFKDRIGSLEGQLKKAANNELVLPKTDQDIEAWSKKYPDVASIVEAIADKKAQERSSDLDSRMQELEELRVTAKKEKAEAELMSFHPDFKTIRGDDAFHNWAEEQPKWVQDALYENLEDAKSVSRVIDLYKSDKNITNKKDNSSDKAAASSVKARTRNSPETDDTAAQWRESQVNKMSTREYEKHADAIMESIRSGKFVYDMK